MEHNKCQVPRCREVYDMYYYGFRICQYHWDKYSDGKINLKEILRIKEEKKLNQKIYKKIKKKDLTNNESVV